MGSNCTSWGKLLSSYSLKITKLLEEEFTVQEVLMIFSFYIVTYFLNGHRLFRHIVESLTFENFQEF